MSFLRASFYANSGTKSVVLRQFRHKKRRMNAPNNTPEPTEEETETPPQQIRHCEPTACPPKPVREAHPPRRTASWGAMPSRMPNLRERTASMDASLSRCAAASAFDPVTPSPPDKSARLVPRVTPEDVRKNLMLDEDLAWATA